AEQIADVGARLRRASDLAGERGVDALLLTPGADLRYLSGYDAHPLERLTCLVVPAQGDPTLVVPLLERAMAQESPAGALVDIGGTTEDGYCSDCTRTYVAGGSPPDDFAAYYSVLQEAQALACAAIRPGITAEAVDAAARDVIADAGYGDYFVHRTGHGIGLEEHEEPYIVSGNDETLAAGMA